MATGASGEREGLAPGSNGGRCKVTPTGPLALPGGFDTPRTDIEIGRVTKPSAGSARAPEAAAPVLEAAGRLFRKKGYTATTIRDIAEAAGVWPGSLHYRYKTKEAVLLALMERGIALAEAGFRAAIAGSDDPIERLRLAMRAHVAMLAGRDHGTYVLLYEGRQLAGEARARMARLRDRYDALWDGLLYQTVGTGRLRPDVDVRLTRLFILGAINWVPQWYSEGGALTSDQIADAFADRVLYGLLRADAATPAARRKRTSAARADRP